MMFYFGKYFIILDRITMSSYDSGVTVILQYRYLNKKHILGVIFIKHIKSNITYFTCLIKITLKFILRSNILQYYSHSIVTIIHSDPKYFSTRFYNICN